jgi:hypothetical protein
MQYLMLIYSEEKRFATMPEADAREWLTRFNAYTASLQASGQLVGSHRLRPTSSATSVRVRDGKVQATDGPFAETREQLGGYYLIEAKDLDEATKIAARCPGAQFGTIEVRPIWAL